MSEGGSLKFNLWDGRAVRVEGQGRGAARDQESQVWGVITPAEGPGPGSSGKEIFVANSFTGGLIFSSRNSYEGERTGRAGGSWPRELPQGWPMGGGVQKGGRKRLKKKFLTARLGLFFLRARVKSSETQKLTTYPLTLVTFRDERAQDTAVLGGESFLFGQSRQGKEKAMHF